MSVVATVDDREPPALVAAVRAHPDVERVGVRRLDAGDVSRDALDEVVRMLGVRSRKIVHPGFEPEADMLTRVARCA